MRKLIACTFVTGSIGSVPFAAAQPACQPDFAPVTQLLESSLKAFDLNGCGLQIRQHGAVVYEQAFGNYTVNTTVPIASASKWLSGAVVMSLVDDGILSLDDTTGQWLGWTGQKGTITIRQLFSHSSGIDSQYAPCVLDGSSQLQACAAEIGALPLIADPGSEVNYGGNSMQVAGAICEVATGTPFTQLYAQRVRNPIGMSVLTTYNSQTNPHLAGGMTSNLRDYGKFLQTVLSDGTFNGQQVFSPDAVEAMLTDQTNGASVGEIPPTVPLPFQGYGIGSWVFEKDESGRSVVNSSPGAFGFTPGIDRSRDLTVVFLVLASNQALQPLTDELRARINAAIDAPRPEGDLNNDRRVGLQDLATLLSNFGSPRDMSLVQGDIDGDGDVDLTDLSRMLVNFGTVCLN